MEAARVCAIRSHEVVLYEKNDRLGGNLIPGGAPDFKEDDHALIRWYEPQLKKLHVTVNLNAEATESMIKELQADELILATGSSPKMLHVEGVEMLTTEDVLTQKKRCRKINSYHWRRARWM